MSDYQPIPCEIYDRYERAILHRDRLRLSWRDDTGQAHLETVVPEDLQTCAGEEFLLGHTLDGAPRRVRLDRILEAVPLAS